MGAEHFILEGLIWLLHICASNGVAIMLTLFAICRVVPIVRMWRTVDAGDRSIAFSVAWIGGYALGLSQHASNIGPGWIADYTAQIYLVNAALVFVDLSLVHTIRKAAATVGTLQTEREVQSVYA